MTQPTTVYKVKSHTDANKIYYVELEPTVSCTCKGFGYRGTCSHIQELKARLNLQSALDELGYVHSSQITFCTVCNVPLPATHAAIGKCPKCISKETFRKH